MTEAPRERTTARKTTQTVQKVRQIVKTLYTRAHEAKQRGQPVAYCMAGSQYDEIVQAMDIVPIWTENYAGLCAAKRAAERFLLKAEADGYSNLICGYVRTGIGFDALRREFGEIPVASPDGGMAEPNMLLGSSQGCDPRYKWYQALGRYKNTPTYSFDVLYPPVDADLGEVRDYYIKYQLEQFKGLVAFLEKQTSKKMDYDRLSHTLDLGDQAWQLWWECDQLRKAVPSPMPSEDHYNAMVPGTFASGTLEAADFYRELRDELKDRVANKKGVIPEEKYRLLFAGGLPPWHTMWIFNYFEEHGAVFAIENAYRVYDPVEVPARITHPLERLAWRTFLRFTQRHEKARKGTGNPTAELLLELIEGYTIDGMVFHASKSCRVTTVGQLYLKEVVQDHVKLPALQLASDIVDVRDYSEAQWKMSIHAFLDAVASAKQHKG